MLRNILATGARLENRSEFIFHHVSGCWLLGEGVSDRYWFSSSSTVREVSCSGPNNSSSALLHLFGCGSLTSLTSAVFFFSVSSYNQLPSLSGPLCLSSNFVNVNCLKQGSRSEVMTSGDETSRLLSCHLFLICCDTVSLN